MRRRKSFRITAVFLPLLFLTNLCGCYILYWPKGSRWKEVERTDVTEKAVSSEVELGKGELQLNDNDITITEGRMTLEVKQVTPRTLVEKVSQHGTVKYRKYKQGRRLRVDEGQAFWWYFLLGGMAAGLISGALDDSDDMPIGFGIAGMAGTGLLLYGWYLSDEGGRWHTVGRASDTYKTETKSLGIDTREEEKAPLVKPAARVPLRVEASKPILGSGSRPASALTLITDNSGRASIALTRGSLCASSLGGLKQSILTCSTGRDFQSKAFGHSAFLKHVGEYRKDGVTVKVYHAGGNNSRPSNRRTRSSRSRTHSNKPEPLSSVNLSLYSLDEANLYRAAAEITDDTLNDKIKSVSISVRDAQTLQPLSATVNCKVESSRADSLLDDYFTGNLLKKVLRNRALNYEAGYFTLHTRATDERPSYVSLLLPAKLSYKATAEGYKPRSVQELSLNEPSLLILLEREQEAE